MKPHDHPDVAPWLDKARSDLRVAALVSELEDPMPDQVCFHAQQAGEKALKALLVALDHPVPRTHDLVLLLHKLPDLADHLADLVEGASLLSEFAVIPRYPTRTAEPTPDDAEEALEIARTIVARTDEILGHKPG